MISEKRIAEINEQIDKLTDKERQYMLWYLMPEYHKACTFKFRFSNDSNENVKQALAYTKHMELSKAALDIRNTLADLLW